MLISRFTDAIIRNRNKAGRVSIETRHPSKLCVKSCVKGLCIFCLGALAGITGPVIFYLMTWLTESLQPGYDPIRETISALAIGPYGWLETFSFFLFSFFLLVFTIRLSKATSRRVTSRIGVVFIIFISLGFLLVGIFPTSEPGTPQTVQSLIHGASAKTSMVLFAIACFLFAVEFKNNPSLRKFYLFTLLTGVIAVVLIILDISAPSDWYWKGLNERALVASGLIWVAAISVRLIQTCACQWRTPYIPGSKNRSFSQSQWEVNSP